MRHKGKASTTAARWRHGRFADMAARVKGGAAIFYADFDTVSVLGNHQQKVRSWRTVPMFDDIGDNLFDDDREPGAGIIANILWAEITDKLCRKAKRMADRLPVDRERGRNPGARVIVNHPDWF